MEIGFLGLGKLGLPCALAAESRGHHVWGADTSPQVQGILQSRKYPFQEVGVQKLLEKTRLRFVSTANLIAHCDIVFVAVQTPHEPEFEGVTRLPPSRMDFDYSHLLRALRALGTAAKSQRKNPVVSVISTVLPGTIDNELKPLLHSRLRICYSPQFIAMGTAIPDYLDPEFFLLGVGDSESADRVEQYCQSLGNAPVYRTSVRNAELIKVAYNTFIGMKIVFANTLMEICHRGGGDVDQVTAGLGLAKRRLLSPAYLRGGMGDGGGCHPRDNIALSWLARRLGVSFDFCESLMVARERQTEWLGSLILQEYKQNRRRIVILGKAFKPETNLVAGSPAKLLYNLLREAPIPQHQILQYDPFVDGVARKDEFLDQPANFFVATKHEAFRDWRFPPGSVIIDPWRYLDSASLGNCKLVQVGAAVPVVSVLCPTRRRREALVNSLNSLWNTCARKDGVEIILRFDDDDRDTADFVNSRFAHAKVLFGERHGYKNLHHYYNEMSQNAQGEWLFLWNDDALMETAGWDEVVRAHSGKFLLLNPKTNHAVKPNCWPVIFPIIPKRWVDITGHFSLNCSNDSWVDQIAAMLRIRRDVEIEVLHDRADLTHNNNDATYRERFYQSELFATQRDLRVKEANLLREVLGLA